MGFAYSAPKVEFRRKQIYKSTAAKAHAGKALCEHEVRDDVLILFKVRSKKQEICLP